MYIVFEILILKDLIWFFKRENEFKRYFRSIFFLIKSYKYEIGIYRKIGKNFM